MDEKIRLVEARLESVEENRSTKRKKVDSKMEILIHDILETKADVLTLKKVT